MALNTQQLESVNSNDPLILCLACAGAGKSTSLVHRIKRLIDSGIDPRAILALTFTNAAAFEMGQKYRSLPGIDPLKPLPEFRTFHSFCYSLIIKDKEIREKLGYSKVPEICEDNQIDAIKKEVKLLTKCSLSDAKLNDDKIKLTPQEKFEKEIYLKAVRNKIREANVITFDMLCYNVCQLFSKDDPTADKYKQRYKHVLNDEFQDSDRRQFQFISSFPATTNIFLVGDALQNLYAFRGTSNEFIKKLSSDPNWHVIKMNENYRSTTQICEFANKFSESYAKPDYRIAMHGQRDGDEVEVIRGSWTSYDTPVCPDHLRKLVQKLKESKVQSAVLCRSNKEVDEVCRALDRSEIVYVRGNKSSEAIDMLNSVLSDSYMLQWLSIAFLDAKHYGDFIRLGALEEEVTLEWFLKTFQNVSKVSSHAKKIFEIRTIMADVSTDLAAKFEKVTKLLGIKKLIKIDDIEAECTAVEFIQRILAQMEEVEETKIYVGTIHSSKGLEYDTVYLMGVDDHMFQLGTEDMNNLYYVGITRAKDHLVVFRR